MSISAIHGITQRLLCVSTQFILCRSPSHIVALTWTVIVITNFLLRVFSIYSRLAENIECMRCKRVCANGHGKTVLDFKMTKRWKPSAIGLNKNRRKFFFKTLNLADVIIRHHTLVAQTPPSRGRRTDASLRDLNIESTRFFPRSLFFLLPIYSIICGQVYKRAHLY